MDFITMAVLSKMNILETLASNAANSSAAAAGSAASAATSESNAATYENGAAEALNELLLSGYVITASYSGSADLSVSDLATSKTGIVVLNDGDVDLTVMVNSVDTVVKPSEEYVGFFAAFTAFTVTATSSFRVFLLGARS
jgi:hypothetical protein